MTVWLIRVAAVFCLVGTLLPLLPVGFWFVRGWDFPRFQLAVLLLITLLSAIAGRGLLASDRELAIWCALLLAALLWQASHVMPFTKIWSHEVPALSSNRESLRMLVVNLDYENQEHGAAIDRIRAVDPDLLLLIEVDRAWRDSLTALESQYEFRHDVVRGEGLGLCLWSRLPLRGAETRYLVEDHRPSIWAELEYQLDTFNLVAIHPTPPGLKKPSGESRRDSRVRDAELALVGREIEQRKGEHWVVAGDFNDVAWSHTTRLFKRLSGLLDPRVGRSFMGTYHAAYPVIRFPIDHVLLSDGFSLARLARHRIPGSDHFGVAADFALTRPTVGVTPSPEDDDREEARELIDEGQTDATQSQSPDSIRNSNKMSDGEP